MRRCVPVLAAMMVAAALSTPALAGIPNLVGNWVTGPDGFVSSGSGPAAAGWNAVTGPKNTFQQTPTIVFEHQDGRIVSGYIVTPSGQHDSFHGMIKPSGSGLTARNANGIIMADLHGNTMDWCWASTAANMDLISCNQLRKAGK